MHFISAALLTIVSALPATTRAQDQPTCEVNPIPVNENDFGEPAWETIIEEAFPTWEVPAVGCPRLDSVGGDLSSGFDVDGFPIPEEGRFNPCYYTKAFAGLDPLKGGYPTPIDTHYPYEFAAPFLKQPGDGSTHHCPTGAVNIALCPKLGDTCGEPDCATITDEYGIGHIPPFVPLAAIKNAYNSCEQDVCTWFHYETSGCNIKKSVLDELVYKYFGEDNKIKYQPPILLEGQPSSTYFRLEYGGESPACDEGNCRGPHYCSVDVANAEVIWGDFCPYVHTGENSGKYRHPHIALAALELWIANKCMPDKCPTAWLDSPNGQGYGTDIKTSTSITWSEMDDNKNPMAQPLVPYKWPNSGDGIFPGHELYDGMPLKPAPGVYVNEVMGIQFPATTEAKLAEASSAGQISVHFIISWFALAALGIVDILPFF